MAWLKALTFGISIAIGVGSSIYLLISRKQAQRQNQLIRTMDFETLEKKTCLICLEEFEKNNKFTLSCKHTFHKSCLKLVFMNEENHTCPSCRKMVSGQDSSLVLKSEEME